MTRRNDIESLPRVLLHRWLGSDDQHCDTPTLTRCGSVLIGCYAGCTTAGAVRNEDGALVWCAADGSWEFAALLDAHSSTDSAELVLDTLEGEAPLIAAQLAEPVEAALTAVQGRLLSLLSAPEFRAECRGLRGETACLIVLRKEQFLWWLCVGDCVVYLFHSELAQRGQFALNQRSYYEWIGRANSFDLAVPCCATGTRELRGGRNVIVLTTDGLLECGCRPFGDPLALCRLFVEQPTHGARGVETSLRKALNTVQREGGRDSATVIAWEVEMSEPGLKPSA
jgi:serine/threonine protein phosphatase PrpC